jgi:hypothetical protein
MVLIFINEAKRLVGFFRESPPSQTTSATNLTMWSISGGTLVRAGQNCQSHLFGMGRTAGTLPTARTEVYRFQS